MRNILVLAILVACGPEYHLQPGTYTVTIANRVYSCAGLETIQVTDPDMTETWTLSKQNDEWTLAITPAPWAVWVVRGSDLGLSLEAVGNRTALISTSAVCIYPYDWILKLNPSETGFFGTSNYQVKLDVCDIMYNWCQSEYDLVGMRVN